MAFTRALLVFVTLVSLVAAQDSTVAGKVERVTLYRGQALVTRLLTVDGPAGPREVVVSGLPEQVVPSSLFADSADGLDVRAVRFRTTAVSEEPREAVRGIDEKLRALAEKSLANAKGQDLIQRRLASLDKLENFVAPTATVELSKGVLDSESLEKLILFSFEQRKKATEEHLSLAKEAQELESQTNLLHRQRAELTQGAGKSLREGVLFLEKRRAGPLPLRISYIVGGCGWSPAYNLRTAGDMTAVDVEYNALIHQMSGEEWSGVELTLSTASPGLNAAAPAIAPFVVDLHPSQPAEAQKGDPAALIIRYQEVQNRREVAATANLLAISSSDNLTTNWEMNAAATAGQALEILEGARLIQSVAGADPRSAEGPSLRYPLEPKVSLASRPDQQLVRITAVRLKSSAYLVANPVLTSFVYREAELVNSSAFDLLGGPMSVYLDGAFVGRGELESVARGQTFVVGFGVDPQVRARREQADKSEKIQGGNKMLTLKYRLVIENYKAIPVSIRVHDRVPHADRSDSLNVILGEMSAKLSEDPRYLRIDRPMGILRWEIQAPASASGEKAFILSYAYTIEHDRNFSLSGPGTETIQKSQQEFERLQKQRQGK
jgi:uncharacterized protein (TIGR02231 family)